MPEVVIRNNNVTVYVTQPSTLETVKVIQGAAGPQGLPGVDGADGVVQSVVAGANVTVDSTDPANPVVSAATPVVDHGALTGLADDDHPQYHTDARGDARYYTQAQVDAALDGKADVAVAYSLRKFSTAVSHTHGSWTKATGTVDDGGTVGFTVTSDTWTPDRTGIYSVIAYVQFPGSGTATARGTRLVRVSDGATLLAIMAPNTTNSSGALAVGMVRLEAGVAYQVEGFQASGATLSSNDGRYSFFLLTPTA